MVKFSIRNFLPGCFLFPYAILNTVCLRNANWIRESLEISTNRQFNFYVNVIFRFDAVLTEDYCSVLSTRINANQSILFSLFSFLSIGRKRVTNELYMDICINAYYFIKWRELFIEL